MAKKIEITVKDVAIKTINIENERFSVSVVSGIIVALHYLF